jgi:hypothetical protein
MPFFLRAIKYKRDEENFTLPGGIWYKDPLYGKFDVFIKQNDNTKFMAHIDGLTRYQADQWVKWINGGGK